jgi:hypothetical protein
MSDTYSQRRSPPARPMLAIVLFMAVYAAALVIMLAPKDMLGTEPGSSIALQGQ